MSLQYILCAHILLAYVTRKQLYKEKCSIVHSYHSAEHIAVRTPVADLAGNLPADLWRDAILEEASRLDAFSGYPCRT